MPYLTPDSPSEGFICRVLQIPNSTLFLSIVEGCLLDLIYPRNFEQHGDLTPEETALLFYDMWDAFHRSTCVGDDMACCYDTVEHRFTDNGILERRINGGNWESDPTDPRLLIPSIPYVIDGNHTKCDAASNARARLEDSMNAYAANMDRGHSIAELAAIILGILFLLLDVTLIGALISPFLIGIAAQLIELNVNDFNAYFSSVIWDEVLCALYCTVGDDGTWNEGAFVNLIGQLAAYMDDGAGKNILIQSVEAMGYKQLSNLAASGTSANADCSDCTCSSCQWSWTISQGANVTSGENWIEADAIPFNNGYYFEAHTDDPAHGCLSYFSAISGQAGAICCIHPPNEWNVNSEDCSLVGIQCASFFGASSGVPFRARVTFIGDC